jgi:pimeloyl-ACP methyl ester carboxylesterase
VKHSVPTTTGHFADLNGVTLHYRRAGQGDPVILLHGIPQTSHEWRYVMPQLAEKYMVIAPDLRGLGDSTRPGGAYDKKTLAADIAALVIEHLGFKRFHLVGHDWGGPVAFAVAAHHPHAVATLTILDVVIPGDGGDFSQGGRRWHHAFFRTLDLPEQLCCGREEIVINWLFENYGHRANCISEEDKAEYLRTYKKPGAFRALLEIYRALPQDVEDNKKIVSANGKLKMPVLALGGDKSFGRGLECVDSLRRVAENVRGGIVRDCGHWIAEEQPDLLVEQLLSLFDEFPIR